MFETVKYYEELGFDTIPLVPGSKKTQAWGWQRKDPRRLWQNAPAGANPGIRGGGEACAAIIDCDDKNAPGTFQNVKNYLAGLGIPEGDYPLVQTPSAGGIGRHCYFSFTDSLPGDARNLNTNMGAGEFRYGPGAYVAAPPSVITGDGIYILINGDFARLPHLALSDILPILGNQDTTPAVGRKSIPRRAMALLHSKNIEKFHSASEAEQSLITSLINTGHSFADVFELFNRYPCAGKYAELRSKSPKNAERWLMQSYTKAADWAANHESRARQTITQAAEWAESTPWPGRTGAVDCNVFLANLEIAYKAGRLNWAASCRDLAERAGVSAKTAATANHRLCVSNLLTLETEGTIDCANVFRLSPGQSYTLPKYLLVRKCVSLSTSHDLFRQGGLGKRAGQIWQVLQEKPATIEDLAERTGAHRKTIKRALARMANLKDTYTGEFLPMVATDDGNIWYSLPSDLEKLALIVGTAGKGKKQKEQHAIERREHNRSLIRTEKPAKQE